jgi:hypothetical protein
MKGVKTFCQKSFAQYRISEFKKTVHIVNSDAIRVDFTYFLASKTDAGVWRKIRRSISPTFCPKVRCQIMT